MAFCCNNQFWRLRRSRLVCFLSTQNCAVIQLPCNGQCVTHQTIPVLSESLVSTSTCLLPPQDVNRDILTPPPEMVSFTPRLLYLSERAYGIQWTKGSVPQNKSGRFGKAGNRMIPRTPSLESRHYTDYTTPAPPSYGACLYVFWKRSCMQLIMDRPPAYVSPGGLTTPHRAGLACYETLYRASAL